MEVTNWIMEKKLKVDFNQGLDARLIDDEVAERICRLRALKPFRIAYDTPGCKDAVLKAIRLLKSHGMNTRSKLICYCYVHDDTQFDFTLERCNLLKEQNVLPYVMLNQDHNFDGKLKVLRRWTQPAVFFKTSYEEYLDSRVKSNQIY